MSKKYKINDFLKLDYDKYHNKDIIINLFTIRVKGTVVNMLTMDNIRFIGICGICRGCNYRGEYIDYLDNTLFYLNLDKIIEHYKTEHIQVIIL